MSELTLRQAARELTAIAAEAREIAARIDAPSDDRWAIARDLRAVAFTIERQAAFAERRGSELGEPEPVASDASRRTHRALLATAGIPGGPA